MSSLEMILRDLRHAVHVLARSPTFSLGVILTLSIILAANTAIFTVLYGVAIRPLPFPDSERLVMLWEANSVEHDQHLPLTESALPTYQRDANSFDDMGGFVLQKSLLPRYKLWNSPTSINAAYCDAGLLRMFHLEPVLGRNFLPEDDAPGAASVVVLSFRFWKSYFVGNPEILGKALVLDIFGVKSEFTIVGILPPAFDFPYPIFPETEDMWLNYIPPSGRFVPGNNVYSLARLRSGVGLTQAQAEIDVLANRLRVDHPKYYGSTRVLVVPLRVEVVHGLHAIFWAFLGSMAFILLIGCGNLCNLFLARWQVRQKEMALRVALGAERSHLVGQLSIEIMIPILVAWILGLFLAWWTVQALTVLLPSNIYVPRLDAVALDVPVFLFTAAISMLSAAAFGVLPVIRLSRPNINELLKSGIQGTRKLPPLFRRSGVVLLISEISFSVIMITLATLMVAGLRSVLTHNAAYAPEKLAAIDVALSNASPQESPQLPYAVFKEIETRVNALPGINSVVLMDRFPLGNSVDEFTVSGVSSGTAGMHGHAESHVVTPRYFDMMGLELLRGRWINDFDSMHAMHVAVINDVMALDYFPHENPLGLQLTPRTSDKGSAVSATVTIVGVIRESGRFGSRGPIHPSVFMSYYQFPLREAAVVIRAIHEPGAMAQSLRVATTKSLLADVLIVHDFETGDSVIYELTSRLRFTAIILSVFSFVALSLALMGTYCVVSHYTIQRNKEIAIRLVLGATQQDVLSLVLRESASIIGLGSVIGLAVAFCMVRILSSILSGIQLTHIVDSLLAAMIFTLFALGAAYLPARKVATLELMKTIHAE